MEQGVGQLLIDIRTDIISPPSSFNLLSIELHEQVEAIPRVGDLWILVATMSPHHQLRFFLPSIVKLFASGDKVIRVEHVDAKYKILVCKLGRRIDGQWRWNFEHEEKVQYEAHQLSIGSHTVINDDPN
jgi:hypothetical protein